MCLTSDVHMGTGTVNANGTKNCKNNCKWKIVDKYE